MKKDTLSWEECALLLSDDILYACPERKLEFLALVKEVGFKEAYEFVVKRAWPAAYGTNRILAKETWYRSDVTYTVLQLAFAAGMNKQEARTHYCAAQLYGYTMEEYFQKYPSECIISMAWEALSLWAEKSPDDRRRKF